MFKIDDKIRVSYGPFADYTGHVVNVGTDGLVQVKLDVIGKGLIATFLPFELEPYRKSQKNKHI